jgi:hypothetical protein
MGNDFWEEYKKRAIYGDALGPPRNATEMAARDLVNHTKSTPSASGGDHASGGGYDIELRFPLRYIFLTFLIASVCGGTSWCIDAFTADETYLPYVSATLLIIGGISFLLTVLQVALNAVNFTLCKFRQLASIPALCYGFYTGAIALVPTGFFFETTLSWFLGGFLPAALIAAGIVWLHDARHK